MQIELCVRAFSPLLKRVEFATFEAFLRSWTRFGFLMGSILSCLVKRSRDLTFTSCK